MFIIGINLVDNQLHHIKRCKGAAEPWKTLCNIQETRSLSNILFIRRKFFTCKMQEGEDLLHHINKVKALADQLACLEVPVRDEDVVMTLLENLPPSYEYLIIALETLPMQDLTMEFVTARLMHEVSKRRKRESQGDDAAMVSMQRKGGTTSTRKDTKTCYYCGKPGHIARFCFKAKNNNKENENANRAKDDDDYAFATKDGDHCKAICKWIMDLGATKHMTPHRAAFDMYEVIPTRNVHMGDDSIVEAIGMGSILVEVMVKGRTKRIRIKDVPHVPKLHANLLSVSNILSSACKVQFNMNECIVKAFDGEVIAIALCEGNLYQVTFPKVCEMHVANVAQTSTIDGALELWHRCLGHLNLKGVHALQNIVSGMNLGNMPCPTSSFVCEGCIEGKQHGKPFPSDGGMHATKPLEIVHSDVCDPMRSTSFGGARYFVTYIDDLSRKVWVYLLKSKGSASRSSRNSMHLWRHNQNTRSRCFGLTMEGSTFSRDSRALPSITSEEAWSGRKPCISHMRVFGCIAYAMVPDEKRGKLDVGHKMFVSWVL